MTGFQEEEHAIMSRLVMDLVQVRSAPPLEGELKPCKSSMQIRHPYSFSPAFSPPAEPAGVEHRFQKIIPRNHSAH
jgi:hypothetical protein